MGEAGKVCIVLVIAVVVICCTGIMFGKDVPKRFTYDNQDIKDTTVWHQDECIEGYLFRHFYQGDKLITTVQVLDNSRLYPSNPREGVYAKAVTCKVSY